MIDHTLLRADATKKEIEKVCKEARDYQFASVCIHPYWVPYTVELLKGSGVSVCTVVGFPLGQNTKEMKAFETVQAVKNGATEIDMVINIGALQAGDNQVVKEEIAAVVSAAEGLMVKVILETCLLSREDIIRGCNIAKDQGAHFVKTSTGFSTHGATVEAVQVMRKTVGTELGVKASGGIRDEKAAKRMIEAGADRLDTSSSVQIVTGLTGKSAY
jgi:deoxyribose-phosphate aldolase